LKGGSGEDIKKENQASHKRPAKYLEKYLRGFWFYGGTEVRGTINGGGT